jgi:hypothetical protein
MILAGATKEEIAANLIKSGLFTKSFDKALHRVQRHIDHLRKEAHMIPLKEDINGVWRFDVKR